MVLRRAWPGLLMLGVFMAWSLAGAQTMQTATPVAELDKLTSISGHVAEVRKTLEQFKLTEAIESLSRPIISVLLALSLVRGYFDGKAASKGVFNAFIALALVTSSAATGTLKDGMQNTWDNVARQGHQIGMVPAAEKAQKAVSGLTVFLLGAGSGTGGILKVVVGKAVEAAVAKFAGGFMGRLMTGTLASGAGPAIGSSADVVYGAKTEFDKYMEGIKTETGKVAQAAGLTAVAEAPFVGAYVNSMLTLAVMNWVISIIVLFALIFIAAGQGRALIGLFMAFIGVIVATGLTPVMFGVAIDIGFVQPIEGLTNSLQLKFDDFFRGMGNSADPVNALVAGVSALTSSFVYILAALVMIFASVAAAVSFLNGVARSIMSAVKS